MNYVFRNFFFSCRPKDVRGGFNFIFQMTAPFFFTEFNSRYITSVNFDVLNSKFEQTVFGINYF